MRILEITTKVGCPVRCDYCPQDVLVSRYKDLEPKTMKLSKFHLFMGKIPIDVGIVFAGMSEPWSHPRCTDMILCVHRLGFKLTVHTTTIGMTFEDIDRISHIPFKYFCIHRVEGASWEIVQMCQRTIPSATTWNPHKPGAVLSRGGNLFDSPKRKGRIGCASSWRNLDHNVLMPNGDVVLCCMDYGMKHVLGNLETDSYESLFKTEWNIVRDGLDDESRDILCRHCELAEGIE
jgi:hypothetical protein